TPSSSSAATPTSSSSAASSRGSAQVNTGVTGPQPERKLKRIGFTLVPTQCVGTSGEWSILQPRSVNGLRVVVRSSSGGDRGLLQGVPQPLGAGQSLPVSRHRRRREGRTLILIRCSRPVLCRATGQRCEQDGRKQHPCQFRTPP